MSDIESTEIQQIAIEDIHILNPRVRNQRVFRDITENITRVGLKRPITVTRSTQKKGKPYNLVCGQGRLEAFISFGQTHIPAIVIDTTEKDALTMSLVENLARRYHSSLDLLKGIELLVEKNYSTQDIANKTGLSLSYVKPIIKLIRLGEERLLSAVEKGQLPLSIALQIAMSPGKEQQALQEAYEANTLRGNKLILARKLIEKRKEKGKLIKHGGSRTRAKRYYERELSGRDVKYIYEREVSRKKTLMRKAEFVGNQLLFVIQALKMLYKEEEFKMLLHSEELLDMPSSVAELLTKKGNLHV